MGSPDWNARILRLEWHFKMVVCLMILRIKSFTYMWKATKVMLALGIWLNSMDVYIGNNIYKTEPRIYIWDWSFGAALTLVTHLVISLASLGVLPVSAVSELIL